MSNTIRFGRKIPMPSTIAIKHELRLMAAVDAVEKAGLWSQRPTADALRDFTARLAHTHEITLDRANLIVERFGSGNRLAVAVDHGDPRGQPSMVA